jgi:hypothetical protein
LSNADDHPPRGFGVDSFRDSAIIFSFWEGNFEASQSDPSDFSGP